MEVVEVQESVKVVGLGSGHVTTTSQSVGTDRYADLRAELVSEAMYSEMFQETQLKLNNNNNNNKKPILSSVPVLVEATNMTPNFISLSHENKIVSTLRPLPLNNNNNNNNNNNKTTTTNFLKFGKLPERSQVSATAPTGKAAKHEKLLECSGTAGEHSRIHSTSDHRIRCVVMVGDPTAVSHLTGLEHLAIAAETANIAHCFATNKQDAFSEETISKPYLAPSPKEDFCHKIAWQFRTQLLCVLRVLRLSLPPLAKCYSHVTVCCAPTTATVVDPDELLERAETELMFALDEFQASQYDTGLLALSLNRLQLPHSELSRIFQKTAVTPNLAETLCHVFVERVVGVVVDELAGKGGETVLERGTSVFAVLNQIAWSFDSSHVTSVTEMGDWRRRVARLAFHVIDGDIQGYVKLSHVTSLAIAETTTKHTRCLLRRLLYHFFHFTVYCAGHMPVRYTDTSLEEKLLESPIATQAIVKCNEEVAEKLFNLNFFQSVLNCHHLFLLFSLFCFSKENTWGLRLLGLREWARWIEGEGINQIEEMKQFLEDEHKTALNELSKNPSLEVSKPASSLCVAFA